MRTFDDAVKYQNYMLRKYEWKQ